MSLLKQTDLFIAQRPEGGDAGTYKITWESILDNIAASPAVQFKGTADFTDPGDDPAPANNGDLWVNTNDGTFAWANPETAGKAVKEGDYCIWDADDGVWRFIGNVGDVEAPVTSVDANDPLFMVDTATTGDVVVDIKKATTLGPGYVERIAIQDDVDNGTAGPVVDAKLLADNMGALSGGLDGVTVSKPDAAVTPSYWDDINDEAATEPALLVSGTTTRNISIHYAEVANGKPGDADFAPQVGVNYIADDDGSNTYDFTGAEADASLLDNLGTVTVRRAFKSFVPRDFDELVELPS